MKATKKNGEVVLAVDFRKNKDAAWLNEMLWG